MDEVRGMMDFHSFPSEHQFRFDDVQGHLVPLDADEGGQSDEDFLMFGSRDDSPASTTLRRSADVVRVNADMILGWLRSTFLKLSEE